MIKTLIFDLDGTLLPMDVNKFMSLYKSSLQSHFNSFDDSQILFDKVMYTLGHMIKDQSPVSNEDKFFRVFKTQITGNLDQYIAHFNTYYDSRFSDVKASLDISKEMIEAIEILKEKGYDLIIATNPIFPYKANLKRIEWAGLDFNDFDYISSLEKNTYCKPNISFYKQVLSSNKLKSDEVLMVGNDVQEDLSIASLGVSTYLIKDHIINREEKYETDYEGYYKDFLKFVISLPEIEG